MNSGEHDNKVEKPVIITLSQPEAQTLISVLRQKVDSLNNSADMAVNPGARGRIIAQAEIISQALSTIMRGYMDYVEAQKNEEASNNEG